MTGREARRLVLGLAAGAAIAFPLGLFFGGGDDAAAPTGATRGPAQARRVFSPDIRNDPYVVDQQRRIVQALETQCRELGEHCTEAAQARRWIDAGDTRR